MQSVTEVAIATECCELVCIRKARAAIRGWQRIAMCPQRNSFLESQALVCLQLPRGKRAAYDLGVFFRAGRL
jgi:hypothetical protein